MQIAVPTKIDDITLGEYQRFAKVNIEGADPEFLLHKTIEIFCGVDLKTAAAFPLKEAEDIQEEIMAVLNQERPFTNTFDFDGVKYGFLPVLEDMTLGEYIDIEEGLKDPSQMHKAAAVMFRPVVKSYKELYTIEPYNPSAEVHAKAKEMPLGLITAAVVFFYNIANELLTVSPHYLREAIQKEKTILERDNLPQSMAGLVPSMHLLKVMLQNTEQ